MQYLRAVTWIGTKEKGQKSAQNCLLSCLEEMFCCVLVAIGMKLCGDRQVYLKLVAAWQVALFSSCPVLQLGWAPRQVTQPASDSLDSTQRSPGAAAPLPNAPLQHCHHLCPCPCPRPRLAPHLVACGSPNTSRLAHSLLANQTGETTGAACFVKMVPIKFKSHQLEIISQKRNVCSSVSLQ